MSFRRKRPITRSAFHLEGSSIWPGLFCFDKLTLRGHPDLFRREKINVRKPQPYITITQIGGYFDLNFQGEVMTPFRSLATQLMAWMVLLDCEGVLSERVSNSLVWLLHPNWDWNDSPLHEAVFLQTLNDLGFQFVGLELAWDFRQDKRPVQRINRKIGRRFLSTLYSGEGKSYYRFVLRNGVLVRSSKAGRRDLVCEYDRSKKIGSTQKIWRFELRLSRHHLDRVDLISWILSPYEWMIWHFPFIGKILRHAVKGGEWAIKQNDIKPEHLGLKKVLQCAGW